MSPIAPPTANTPCLTPRPLKHLPIMLQESREESTKLSSAKIILRRDTVLIVGSANSPMARRSFTVNLFQHPTVNSEQKDAGRSGRTDSVPTV